VPAAVQYVCSLTHLLNHLWPLCVMAVTACSPPYRLSSPLIVRIQWVQTLLTISLKGERDNEIYNRGVYNSQYNTEASLKVTTKYVLYVISYIYKKKIIKIYIKKKICLTAQWKKNEHKIMTNCHNASCTIVGVGDTIVSYQQYCLYAWWYCLMQRWICDGGCITDALQFFLGNILPFHDTVLKNW